MSEKEKPVVERVERHVATFELFLAREGTPTSRTDAEVEREVEVRLEAVFGHAPIGKTEVRFLYLESVERR